MLLLKKKYYCLRFFLCCYVLLRNDAVTTWHTWACHGFDTLWIQQYMKLCSASPQGEKGQHLLFVLAGFFKGRCQSPPDGLQHLFLLPSGLPAK